MLFIKYLGERNYKMQINEFISSLGCNPGLFFLKKQDFDLLILAQLNTITISQLHLIGLHGETPVSTRLALNRLAKKELVIKKTIPNHNNLYYFTLTQKGIAFLKEMLPEDVLKRLDINWERRPPIGSQQIMHRILANDFYCSFLSYPTTLPSIWRVEEPLNNNCNHKDTQPPRADGFLSTCHADYYIEQDNQTQSEPILKQKIQQYLKNGVFSPSEKKKVLVFTLASPKAKLPNTKSNYTIYRMLVKVCQAWERFEKEYHLPLDYLQFCQLLTSSSYNHGITDNELMTLEQLHYVFPDFDDLASANTLKKHFMDDTGYLEAVGKEMDAHYNKRLKSAFKSFYEHNKRLVEHAITGNNIYAVPNHRLKQCQPYITSDECNLKELLLKTLFYNNLNIDGWEYHEPYVISSTDKVPLYFARGFFHASYGHIVFEFPGADLSAHQRLLHYKNHYSAAIDNLVIILLGAEFLQSQIINDYDELLFNHAEILFTKELPSIEHSSNVDFYFLHQPNTKAVLDCDTYDEKLHLLPKGDIS